MRHTISIVSLLVVTLIFAFGPNSYALVGESIDQTIVTNLTENWVVKTYYWDDGWVEHASWDASYFGPNLQIEFDAYNWPPEYSPSEVIIDNVYAFGDIDLPQGLIDDFNDDLIAPIWSVHGSCPPIEADGVLTIAVIDGEAWPGQNCVGGLYSEDFFVHDAFDVRIDFTLNPEFYSTPNTNFKFQMLDESGYSPAVIYIHNGQMNSIEAAPPSGTWMFKKSTSTDQLQGKLRITRSLARKINVAIDIKPNNCPNPGNLNTKGVLPVAVVGTGEFDVTLIDPASILLEGVPPVRWSLDDVTTPFEGELVDQYSCSEAGPDGFTDLVLKFDYQEVLKALGNLEVGQVGAITLQGNLKDGYDNIQIIGQDMWVTVGGR